MHKTCLTIVGLLATGYIAPAQTLSPVGVWLNSDKATLQIYTCGNQLCGSILKLPPEQAVDPQTGKGRTDVNNPDARYRDRPVEGMQILRGLTYDQNNKWDNGSIYDPQTGKTYSCYLLMAGPKKLELSGNIGFSMMGRSQKWTRVK